MPFIGLAFWAKDNLIHLRKSHCVLGVMLRGPIPLQPNFHIAVGWVHAKKHEIIPGFLPFSPPRVLLLNITNRYVYMYTHTHTNQLIYR